jgi:hypothetical protein
MLVALLIAASIAGHPVGIACDADRNNPFPMPVDGWAHVGGDTAHITPRLCAALGSGVQHPDFPRALSVLIHESAHLRGVRREACAELYAHVLAYQVLQEHYNVPFFTVKSKWIVTIIVQQTRLLPPEYQPQVTSCDDQP